MSYHVTLPIIDALPTITLSAVGAMTEPVEFVRKADAEATARALNGALEAQGVPAVVRWRVSEVDR